MNDAFLQPLCDAGAAFYRFGWLFGTSGNLSRRIDEKTFTISVSGCDKGALTANDFVTVNVRGSLDRLPKKPSAETTIHQAVYEKFPNVGVVYHVHDPFAALCSRRDQESGATIFSGWEMIKGLGVWDSDEVAVPILENFSDVPRIASEVTALLELGTLKVPGVNIASHGVYAWGETPADAKRVIESFAYLFKVSWEMNSKTGV